MKCNAGHRMATELAHGAGLEYVSAGLSVKRQYRTP
jgi:hypothetical protein